MLHHERMSTPNEQRTIFAQSVESLEDLSVQTPPAVVSTGNDSDWNFQDVQGSERGESTATGHAPRDVPPAESPAAALAAAATASPPARAPARGGHLEAARRRERPSGAEGCPRGAPSESLPSVLCLRDLMTQSAVCLESLGGAPTLEDVVTGPDDPVGCANLTCSFDGTHLFSARASAAATALHEAGPLRAGGGAEARAGAAAGAEAPVAAGAAAERREGSARGRRPGGEDPRAEAAAAVWPETCGACSEEGAGVGAGAGAEDAGAGAAGRATQAKNPGIGNESKML